MGLVVESFEEDSCLSSHTLDQPTQSRVGKTICHMGLVGWSKIRRADLEKACIHLFYLG